MIYAVQSEHVTTKPREAIDLLLIFVLLTYTGPPPMGEPPWRGGGAYGLRGSCRFRFLGIQRGGDY